MHTLQYKHIIWDWNGTLFDDAWLCVDIMNGLLARRDLPQITPAYYQAVFDFPVSDYYRLLGFDFSAESFEHISDEFMGVYHRRMLECGLRDGTRDVLDRVSAQGLTQSMLSAMKQTTLARLVTHFALTDYFTELVGLSDHHASGKIETGKEWIAGHDLQPNAMLFVGDTTHDYEVARALGVDCVLIHSGHHSRERLAAVDARLITSLSALDSVLDRTLR